jgi:uncharacterized membrane protein YkvA (DUF1232 family)
VRTSRRFLALSALWAALRGRLPGPALADRLRAVPAMTRDVASGRFTGVARGRLVATAAALAYLVVPLDVIPEALLGVVGLVDDAVVAAWAAGSLLDATGRYLAWRSPDLSGLPSVRPGTDTPGVSVRGRTLGVPEG